VNEEMFTRLVWDIVNERKRKILDGSHRSEVDKKYFAKAANVFLDALVSDKPKLQEDILIAASEILNE